MNTFVRDQQNLTAPAVMTTQGDIIIASGANTPIRLAKSTTSTQYLANTGTSNAPAWNEVALATGVSGTLPVGNGGTGATTLTANGALIGNGTSAIASVDMTTKGGLLAGDGSGNPSVLAIGGTADHVLTVDSGETTGMKWAAVSGGAQVATGTYTGNGATSFGITGIGFAPKVVFLARRGLSDGATFSDNPWMTWTTLVDDDVAGCAIDFDDSAGRTRVRFNSIISLDADGFTVDDAGANAEPNVSGVLYNFWCTG